MVKRTTKEPPKRKKKTSTKKTSSRREGDALYPPAEQVHIASTKVREAILPLMREVENNVEIHGEARKPCYTVKDRIKPTFDIVSKVNRKREGARRGSKNYEYEPEHVTDGLGFRFVTLFQQDILLVVRELIKVFTHQPPYTHNPIPKNSGLKEAVIYTNRPLNEEGAVHTLVSEMLKKAGFKPVMEDPVNRKSGYSSVHFVVFVQYTSTDGKSKMQPMEIQVRDIFEEAWSEIDHALRYVNEREGVSNVDDIFNRWMLHLNALKKFADGCSQHASLIKTNAIDHLKMRNLADKRIPSEEPSTAARFLKEVLPETFHTDIAAAFEAQDRATSLLGAGAREVELASAAETFKSLIKRTKRYAKTATSDGRDVGFRLGMEYAFCLQPENGEEEKEVIAIYETMRKRFPEDPFTYYRHASALRKRGDLDGAMELLETGLEHLAENNNIAEGAWIRSAMPRLLGLIHWQRSKQFGGDGTSLPGEAEREAKIACLEKAIGYSEQSLEAAELSEDGDEERSKCINNLVFFIFEFLKVRGKGTRKINRSVLEHYTNMLDSHVEPSDASSIYRLHTIMTVWNFLDKKQEAKRHAQEIGEILYEIAKGAAGRDNLRIDQVREHLHGDLYDIHDDVRSMLFKNGDDGDEKD